eukprot:10999037-Lingulodinium_polyedra.AAC.1
MLGWAMHPIRAVLELRSGRAHRLDAVLRHCARLRRVSGAVLEVLVGHCTSAFLLRRCLLSVFGRIYAFMRE